MSFRSVAKSVTLSDLEWPNVRHYALFHTKQKIGEQTTSNSLKLDPYCYTIYGSWGVWLCVLHVQ